MHVTPHLQPSPASTALTCDFHRIGAGIGSPFRVCEYVESSDPIGCSDSPGEAQFASDRLPVRVARG